MDKFTFKVSTLDVINVPRVYWLIKLIMMRTPWRRGLCKFKRIYLHVDISPIERYERNDLDWNFPKGIFNGDFSGDT